MASKRDLIQPRTLKGFRDFLPESMHAREWLLDTAREVFRSYGFAGIDTPVLEYEEILTGKGSEESDKQMYAFEDNGGRRVGMRFDLTVPLARFVAQHENELGMPFKRYHIGPVWRAENTQRGRYREFMQCDFDTIGTASNTTWASLAPVYSIRSPGCASVPDVSSVESALSDTGDASSVLDAGAHAARTATTLSTASAPPNRRAGV